MIRVGDHLLTAIVSELDNIRSNPIKEGLDPFRRLFESMRIDLGIATSSDVVQAALLIAITTGIHLMALTAIDTLAESLRFNNHNHMTAEYTTCIDRAGAHTYISKPPAWKWMRAGQKGGYITLLQEDMAVEK